MIVLTLLSTFYFVFLANPELHVLHKKYNANSEEDDFHFADETEQHVPNITSGVNCIAILARILHLQQ